MPGKPIKIKIESLDSQGHGEFLWEGEKYALPGTIPGERIALNLPAGPKSLSRIKKKSWSLLEASPDRRPAPCPYFGECGGCQLQPMTEERQLLEKKAWLQDLFRDLLPQEKVPPLIASPQSLGYRRRVQFQAGPQGAIGFFAEGSHRVVPIEACLLAADEINRSIPELRKRAEAALTVRNRPNLLSFEVTLDDTGKLVIQKDREERSFLQANPGANEKLLEYLKQRIQALQAKRVIELYAGEGNFTFSLANSAEQWWAVESNPSSLKNAREKAQPPSLRWAEGDAALVLKKILSSPSNWDLVLLDPPRQGAQEVVELLATSLLPHILYVSCNPLTLKRDAKKLCDAGYILESLQGFDFFPQTMNLETLASFRRPS